MENDSLEFQFDQSDKDTTVLNAVASQIYSLPRIILWCVFSWGLFITMILSLSEDNMHYATPLLIFSGLLAIAALSMMIITFVMRPNLLNSIQGYNHSSFCVQCTPDNIHIKNTDHPTFNVNYKDVLSQFWCENSYILHIRRSEKGTSMSHCLLLIPLTDSTFDDVFALATVLEQKKIRLRRIRIKIA